MTSHCSRTTLSRRVAETKRAKLDRTSCGGDDDDDVVMVYFGDEFLRLWRMSEL